MNSKPESLPEVDATVAYDAFASGTGIVLDVRELDELQQVAVRGAVHIPLGDLQNRMNEVPSGDQDVYILCHVGQRSAIATEFLRSSGHQRVWNIRGGIISWLRSGLPADWSRTG